MINSFISELESRPCVQNIERSFDELVTSYDIALRTVNDAHAPIYFEKKNTYEFAQTYSGTTMYFELLRQIDEKLIVL